MKDEANNSLKNKSWFQGIVGFCALQIGFLVMEWTGWIPNIRDYEGKLLGNISDLLRINDWAIFYETPYFNLITVFAGIILLGGIFTQILRAMFRKQSY